MAEAYSFELRDQAEELYVEQGLTYEAVAAKLGIALNTAKNWGAQYEWAEKRKRHYDERRALKENIRMLRQKMITKASDNLDPSDIYAVVKLERLVKDQMDKQGDDKGPEIDRPRLFLEDMEFVASTLKEIDPEGLKMLSRNFETIVTRFKEKHAKAA